MDNSIDLIDSLTHKLNAIRAMANIGYAANFEDINGSDLKNFFYLLEEKINDIHVKFDLLLHKI